MHYETTTTVRATPARVWAVLSDVERWPHLISVYQELRRLDGGDLRVGSTARVKQDGLPAGTWTVTDCVPGTSFTWTSGTPGIRTVASHTISSVDDSDCSLTLVLDQTGRLAGVVEAMLGARVRHYVDEEAAALTLAAQSPTPA